MKQMKFCRVDIRDWGAKGVLPQTTQSPARKLRIKIYAGKVQIADA